MHSTLIPSIDGSTSIERVDMDTAGSDLIKTALNGPLISVEPAGSTVVNTVS